MHCEIISVFVQREKGICYFKSAFEGRYKHGANVHEAVSGQSEKDFIAKMHISYKEATESEYWINLLVKTDYLCKEQGKSILEDCIELKRIISSIIMTTKEKTAESRT